MVAFALGRFQVDATPPPGHPLCGGWIAPAAAIDGRLSLRGLVLVGEGLPVVVAALDWTGLLNEAHERFAATLATAAGTTPDRVALHCVHQHDAPFVDLAGNRLLRGAGASPLLVDEKFYEDVIDRSSAAVRRAVDGLRPVGTLGVGAAPVEEVASTRRVLGPDGKVALVRYSSSRDPAAQAAPEGLIDPLLRCLSLFEHGTDRPLAWLFFYAVHPMSHYGAGRVSPDFVGLARDRCDAEEPGTLHLYLTGGAGDVTAGKYNDGSPPMRGVLADRVHAAMVASAQQADEARRPFDWARWRSRPHTFRPRPDLDLDRLAATIRDPAASVADRNRSAMAAAWLDRLAAGRPVLLGALDLPGATLLSLPAETFVAYQLEAQRLAPDRAVCVAAYADGGPWYIPLRRSFAEGGYEPSASFVHPDTEAPYRAAIAALLGAKHDEAEGRPL